MNLQVIHRKNNEFAAILTLRRSRLREVQPRSPSAGAWSTGNSGPAGTGTGLHETVKLYCKVEHWELWLNKLRNRAARNDKTIYKHSIKLIYQH